jgi:hypothetical protein
MQKLTCISTFEASAHCVGISKHTACCWYIACREGDRRHYTMHAAALMTEGHRVVDDTALPQEAQPLPLMLL